MDFGVNLREVTLLFLELISERYARVLIKNHGVSFVDGIFAVGFKILSEDPELYEGQDAAPPEMACTMLYSFASTVPNEKVFPIVKKYLQIYGTSTNEHERAGAVYFLGHISDSDCCLDPIKDEIDVLTTFVVDKLTDASSAVRESAAETVGRFSENVVPEFLDKHKVVMPSLIAVARELQTSKHEMVIQKSLYAVSEFVQNLDYDIKHYLEQLVKLLLEYATSTTMDRESKYWALVALSNSILVAERSIKPYIPQLVPVFYNIISAQTADAADQKTKGQTLVCAGRVLAACGKDQVDAQTLQVFTAFGLECLKGGSQYELRETAVTYFADLSVLLKEDIAPYFTQVMDEILKICSEEIQQKTTEAPKQGFSLDSDSEGGDVLGVNIDIGHVDEKASAINALGILAMHAPLLCFSRMQEILAALEKNQFFFHENVKFHTVLAYMQIGLGLMKKNGVCDADDKFNWTKGAPSGSPLPQEVVDFFDKIVIPYFFETFKQEENKEVIERVLENMREMLIDFGPAVFVMHAPKVIEIIIAFLQKKTFCQSGDFGDDNEVEDVNPEEDDEEEEEEDDGIDHDEVILGNVTDLILYWARALGNDFA